MHACFEFLVDSGHSCFEATIKSLSEEPHTNMWELGQCSSSHSYDKIGTYIERCCTPPVEHTLICRSSENTYWPDKLLKINGHAFCDDFAGYKAIRMIRVQGILDEIR